jgi:cell division septum initiation protein DivIVA
MPYTPVELRHVRVGRGLLGYKRDAVEDLLDEVADSFEEVWRDRGELADKVEELEKQLAELKSREQLLASTLVSAERAAVEAKEAAKREAELIVAESHQEARSITRAAQAERKRLFAEARRVEALLRSALGIVDEAGRGGAEEPPQEPRQEEGEKKGESWPRREDTREFGRAGLFVPTEPDAQAG